MAHSAPARRDLAALLIVIMAWTGLSMPFTSTAQYTGGFGGGGHVSCLFPSIVLPVEMLWMEVACDKGTPILRWATGSERNSSHFIIERSVDTELWVLFGHVPAAGSSQQVIEYSWVDPQPIAISVMYYRLRQVDLDGKEELFPVVPLLNCASDRAVLSVFPNPAAETLHVVVNHGTSNVDAATLEFIDAIGRPVMQQRMGLEAGQGSTELDLNGLSAGSYLLRLLDDAGNARGQVKVLKQ